MLLQSGFDIYSSHAIPMLIVRCSMSQNVSGHRRERSLQRKGVWTFEIVIRHPDKSRRGRKRLARWLPRGKFDSLDDTRSDLPLGSFAGDELRRIVTLPLGLRYPLDDLDVQDLTRIPECWDAPKLQLLSIPV